MKQVRSLIGGLALLLTCAGPAAAENVLRWASPSGALTVDPHAYDEIGSWAQFAQVYERLILIESDLDFVPGLAVAWRLVEPTIWEFELRRNVRFHDGTPFTAEDVVFSFARAKTELPSGLAARIESVAEVRAVDDHTVRVETKFRDPQLWDRMRDISIMSKRWAEAHDARVPANVSAGEENYASRHANGTGPFILKEFAPNGPVVMVRNPDWWGFERYPHNIDRIEYTPIADPEERIAALLQGDLDLLIAPPLDALEQIERAPGLKLAQTPELRTVWLTLDQGSPELRSSDIKGRNPFKDRRVRQAIYQAIDIETIRRDVMGGLAIPAGMLVAPGAIGYAPDLDRRLPYDPEAAKALLASAGYPQGFSVTLDCANDSGYINEAEICRTIAAQLREVGIVVTANVQPRSIVWPKMDNRESDFFFGSWSAIDSELIFKHQYRTAWTEDSANVSGYSSPQVDDLIAKLESADITYGRDAYIEEVWKIVLADIVYVPLHHQMVVWAMRDNLELPVFPYNLPWFMEARFTAPKAK